MNSIGVDFKLKNINVENKSVKLQIWDTAGQERFRTITTSYYKGAQAIIIVFDLTEKDSFDHVKNWMVDIDKFAKESVMKVLVGNKSDMMSRRVISEDAAKELARRYNIEYLETSAKDCNNIDDLFVSTTTNFIINNNNNPMKKSFNGIKGDGVNITPNNLNNGGLDGKDKKKKKKRCC